VGRHHQTPPLNKNKKTRETREPDAAVPIAYWNVSGLPKTAGGLGWLVQALAGGKIDVCVVGEALLNEADKALVRVIPRGRGSAADRTLPSWPGANLIDYGESTGFRRKLRAGGI
jgi:hypothetical protein